MSDLTDDEQDAIGDYFYGNAPLPLTDEQKRRAREAYRAWERDTQTAGAWDAIYAVYSAALRERSPPREPTPEMLRAVQASKTFGAPHTYATEIWRAMYDASPQGSGGKP